ncbi:hypothetical protein GCM10023226_10470 [Nocardioides nanhaiensis]|uniref:Integral membrane sensor signal transduction histidine kinase n=1 Tax=Nocardioides nanhaiensis TaxID=1476871 RepID=A0ABP8VY12_9ACTN
MAVVGVFAARNLAEREAVNDAAASADLIAEAVIQPALRDDLVDQDPAAVAAMDDAVRQYLENTTLTRIKLWTRDGTIVFSDEPRLLGQRYELDADDLEVFEDPQVRGEISDLSEPENRFERGSGQMLEVYRPVWTPNGTPLLFETYSPYDDVDVRAGQLWRGFAGVTLSSLLFFAALLLPIGARMLVKVRRAQRQREAALEAVVEASAEERRRIAGNLHDGVVQELAATAFTVAGAAARAEQPTRDPGLGRELHESAGTLRASIGSLRSLLVDIYPATLTSGGLAEALDDLAASLRTVGVAVQVEVADDGAALDEDGRRLVFRVAQECLQNVRRHAGAREAVVRLTREEDAGGAWIVLDVADDGVGFDPDQALDAPARGHFGLRVLRDLASAGGAELLLDTARGAGCHWRLRVPLP